VPWSPRVVTPAWRGKLERRETVVDWLAGGEDEEFPEPKAFSATMRKIFVMGSPSESAFTSAMIPMPSSRAAPMSVETPGAPPV